MSMADRSTAVCHFDALAASDQRQVTAGTLAHLAHPDACMCCIMAERGLPGTWAGPSAHDAVQTACWVPAWSLLAPSCSHPMTWLRCYDVSRKSFVRSTDVD
jgi:hypothetical protein